ncbi:MAG: PspC domain-containing protein, partial [Pseudonocardia sp.]|nr:PspC domain-containing protein [Pseudonocardia sp.]
MKSTDVPATFRDMWETRPARPRDDRMVAGVAAGIARRYDIDPVLVRVGFVVAALSGIGAVLYIAGWIVLPDTPAAPDAPRRRRPNVMLMVAIGIAIAIGFGGLFGDGGGFLLPALAVAALLFLLHTYRGDRPTVPPPADPAAEPATGVSLTKDLPGTPPQPTPPSWDPLGAAPFAWDLPEPSPVEPPAPAPRRAPVTAVTLGAALLAGGATAAIMLLTGALSFAT